MSALRHDGFSLLEMLIVLMIFAIASSLFMVRYPGNGTDISTANAARLIAAAFQEYSAKSISSGQSVNVEIDIASRRLSAGKRVINIPGQSELLVRTGAELIAAENIAVIQFYPDGTSSGGAVYLGSSGQDQVIVQVNWINGSVSLRRFQ